MPPRISLVPCRSLAWRPQSKAARILAQPAQSRLASDNASKQIPPNVKGPNMEQLPHVTEEQAATDKTMGQTPPDIEQGTPVQEIMKRDPEAQKKAPQVIKEQVNTKSSDSGQKRSYSTSTRRLAETEMGSQQPPDSADLVMFDQTMAQGLEYPHAGFGHKFPLPDIRTISRTDHLKRRYDSIVDQVTKSIMRHGKLSVAQKNMSHILDTLRTASPPSANPAMPGRSLLTPLPRSALPLNPVQYLTAVIDSVAPIIKIRQQRGIAGGGASLPIPVPLGQRQRRRQAIQWILDAASKRKETYLADRVAKEIIGVAEGKSSAWERRALVHRLAVSARSNVRTSMSRITRR